MTARYKSQLPQLEMPKTIMSARCGNTGAVRLMGGAPPVVLLGPMDATVAGATVAPGGFAFGGTVSEVADAALALVFESVDVSGVLGD